MKKLLTASIIVALVLALGGLGTVQADQIEYFGDTTNIQYWNTGITPSSTTTWGDLRGDNFETYGGKFVNASDGTLTLFLYTKFGGANTSATGADVTVLPADLFLDGGGYDVDGTYDFAIRLRGDTPGTGAGSVYEISNQANIKTSVDIMTPSGDSWQFGGAFGDTKTNSPVPVEVVSKNPYNTTTVAWQFYNSFDLNGTPLTNVWEVSIMLSGIGDESNGFYPVFPFAFVWGTGTCGNDVIVNGTSSGFGPVPLPPSVLLMGSGLVGLGLLRFRRRKRTM